VLIRQKRNRAKDFETSSSCGYHLCMIHEIIAVGPLQCNCSIVGDEASHEAMVIDPGADVSEILAIVARHRLQVKQIVVTHAHLDHIGGAMELKAATGAPILLNENDAALVAMLPVQAQWLGMRDPGKMEIDCSPKSGDKIVAGSLSGEILLTPGHTEGSLCLYFEPEKKLIAGDTLFAGSIGRTDLPLTTIGEEREDNPYLQS
jgi:glyoxylase-like metal-dependent hydrolase (beta-lactamase superfamily II)